MKKKYPFCKQEGMFECAVASVMMILKYYGGNINKIKLTEHLKTSKKGTNAYNIVETLKYLGFNAKGIRATFSDIKTPSIAHVEIGYLKHYVVIFDIDYKKKTLVVGDPAERIKTYSFCEFEKIWTNVLIVCYPERKVTNEKNISVFKFFVKFLKPYRLKFILIGLFSIVSIFVSILLSFSLQFIFYKLTFIFILLLFSLFKMFLDYIRNNMLLKVINKIDYDLSASAFEKILNLPYCYYQGKTSGEIAYKVNDLENVKKLVEIGIMLIFIDVPLIFISFIFLMLISIKLFLLLLISTLILVLISYKFHFKLKIGIEKYKNAHLDFFQKLVEKVEAFETIKGLGIENNMQRILKDKKKDSNLLSYLLMKKENQMTVLKDFALVSSNLFIFCLGFYFVNENMLSLGLFMTFILLSSYFKNPIINILNLDFEISEAIFSLKKIIELMSFEENKKISFSSKIVLRNVCYTFDEAKDSIKDMNLQFLKNEKILITGKSGSGKSTLLKLIMNFINPTKGKINHINGKYVYISQNERLFTGTLESNLKIFNNNDLSKIISICCLEDVILKNDLGLKQLIFENGFNLSGGQKQRIYLARALMKDFDVLLIDEGLNQVDISMERKILKSLFTLYKDKLIIVVSHRLDNIDLFERVIKLNDGKVIFDLKKNKGEIEKWI